MRSYFFNLISLKHACCNILVFCWDWVLTIVHSHLKQSSIFNFQDSAKKSRAKKDESLRHLKGTNAKLRKMSKELETTFKEIMEKRINLKNMEALYRRRLQRLRRILERKGTSTIKSEWKINDYFFAVSLPSKYKYKYLQYVVLTRIYRLFCIHNSKT